jgi:hypothetical protein
LLLSAPLAEFYLGRDPIAAALVASFVPVPLILASHTSLKEREMNMETSLIVRVVAAALCLIVVVVLIQRRRSRAK